MRSGSTEWQVCKTVRFENEAAISLDHQNYLGTKDGIYRYALPPSPRLLKHRVSRWLAEYKQNKWDKNGNFDAITEKLKSCTLL